MAGEGGGFTIIVSASMKVARRHATRGHEAAAKVKTGGSMLLLPIIK